MESKITPIEYEDIVNQTDYFFNHISMISLKLKEKHTTYKLSDNEIDKVLEFCHKIKGYQEKFNQSDIPCQKVEIYNEIKVYFGFSIDDMISLVEQSEI